MDIKKIIQPDVVFGNFDIQVDQIETIDLPMALNDQHEEKEEAKANEDQDDDELKNKSQSSS